MYIFSNLCVSGLTSPLPHMSMAGEPLPVLGDIQVHCSKTWSPCNLALLPWGGGPFPDLSHGGFAIRGVWIVSSRARRLWAGQVKPRRAGGAKNQGSGSPPEPSAHPAPADPAAHPVSVPVPKDWLVAAREGPTLSPFTGRS